MASKGIKSRPVPPAAPVPEPVAAKPPVRSPKPAAAPAKPIEPSAIEAPAPIAAPTPDLPAAAPAPVIEAAPAAMAEAITTPEPAAPAITSPINPPSPAAEPAATIQKDMTMDATIENAADKTQTMFADLNGRAKSALEKSTQAIEQMNEFGKGNIEAIVESGKIAAKGFETIGQDAADYGRRQFEGATAAIKALGAIKSPTEFFKFQSDYVRQSFDSMVAETSKNTEAMLKLAGEVAQPISNRVAIAAEKVKLAA